MVGFKVKNFRSIKDEVYLDLRATSDKTMKAQSVFENDKTALLKSAAIYGPNASGKSNIFKALIVFRLMILESLLRSNTSVDLPAEYFKLNLESENAPSFFEMDFLLNEEIVSYGFEMNKKRICAEWLKKERGNVTLFERVDQNIKSNKNYFQEATKVLKDQTSERVLFLSILASNNKPISKEIVQFIQKINCISAADRGNTLDYSFGQYLSNSNRASKIRDFMVMADFGVVDIVASEKMISAKETQNIPDKFKELLFKENSKIAERSLRFLHKKHDKNGKEIESEALDFFAEESEGTQQFFALSAPVIDTLEKGKILFIDEIDASLHPMLCQYLVSIFNSKKENKKNSQLVFTTHDISLLNEEFLRRDQIYFADKNDEGMTNLFSLMNISERKGLDFAKRYLEGRYSALPYIVNFENIKFSK
ncbi:MAG: ATP-binding protein [Candidatus Moranbacteria bacterium]|nr:ATP-binding protein [Candidatus Moranbacteria bacterium]